jgi:hypothetical protein
LSTSTPPLQLSPIGLKWENDVDKAVRPVTTHQSALLCQSAAAAGAAFIKMRPQLAQLACMQGETRKLWSGQWTRTLAD